MVVGVASVVSAEVESKIETGFMNEVGGVKISGDGCFNTSLGELTASGFFQAFSEQIAGDGDVFQRSGKEVAYSLREFHFAGERVTIGKQTFVLDGADWNFADLSPFGYRNVSGSVFHVLDSDETLLGNWGVTVQVAKGLQLVAFQAEPSILPLDQNNPYSFTTPSGFEFGDVESNVGWSLGAQGVNNFSDVLVKYAIQHGAGNSPIDADVKLSSMTIHPLIVKQTAASLSFEMDWLGWTYRIGGVQIWPENYAGFIVIGGEAERFWENLIWNGDNFFLAIGHFDVLDQEGSGDVNLDFRRAVYAGGTAMLRIEYSPSENWVLKLTGASNPNGYYISPQLTYLFDQCQIDLGYDHFEGDDGVWEQYSHLNTVTLRFSVEF